MQPLPAAHPLPLYARLAGLLSQRIARGEWKGGDRLPSHDLLTREFAVTRVTVRQAITLLEEDGLVLSRQGRGTFVTARPGAGRPRQVQFPLRDVVTMFRGDGTPSLNLSEGDAAPVLTDRDGAAASTYVHMRRVHLRKDTPHCVIPVHLDAAVVCQALEGFRRELLIPILASMPGVTIAQSHRTLTTGAADPEAAAQLGAAVSAPAAHVRRVLRAPDGTVPYLGDVVHRGNLIQLEMELVP